MLIASVLAVASRKKVVVARGANTAGVREEEGRTKEVKRLLIPVLTISTTPVPAVSRARFSTKPMNSAP